MGWRSSLLVTHSIPAFHAANRRRARALVLLAAASGTLSMCSPRWAAAQGIATAAIVGTVRSTVGATLDAARVRVVNTATGVASNAVVRGGRFFVQGIEVGGPYVVEIRLLGFVPQRSAPLFLALGERREMQFVLQPGEVRLDAMVVSARAPLSTGAGTATLVPEALVSRLPTPDRNFYDFVRLAPQVSTKVGSQRVGVSAAGANLRFNNFLINGVDERFVNGNVSAASNVGKSIPLAAVKEFQVLVAPYDVRYGDFAGALVNTVTQSGTNDLHGSLFTYWRSDRTARGGELATTSAYDRVQSGFSLGGAIVRDRVHFFVAPEVQRFTSPAAGPYVGQPPGSSPPVPVSDADLRRLDDVMRGYGLIAGSSGPVQLSNPLVNIFARVDATLPGNSRAFVLLNHAGASDSRFSRAARDTFSLSSYLQSTSTALEIASLQVHTDLPRTSGGHNEFVVSLLRDRAAVVPEVQQPIVRVLAPGMGGSLVTLNTGSFEQAQGRSDPSHSVTVRDEVSIPLGSRNIFVIGGQLEHFQVKRSGVAGSYGTWTFSSIDSLAQGLAERYELRKDLGSADAPLTGAQYAAYAGDEWRPVSRLAVTFGARMDLMSFASHAPFNPVVDSIFGRRTDEMPGDRLHVSPRLGFQWDINGAARDRVRGGIGIFTGRPPRAWIRPAVVNYGLGTGFLKCGSLTGDTGAPPIFNPDYRRAPTVCATGPALASAPAGDIDLIDRNLRMAQSLRTSLAYDRALPGGIAWTTEALYSRYLSDFMFVNLNLRGPQSTDRFGRVLYGSISATGVPTPALRLPSAGVVDLVNTANNYSYQLSTRLEKHLADRLTASASYTFSRTRDVESPSRVNLTGKQLWADARTVSGQHDDTKLGVSLNDLPHRLVGTLTYAAPWSRWSTDVAMYYVAESGSPFTYVAWGAGNFGDLNSDGANTNDPIYIPRDVSNVSEIHFSGRSDAAGADNSAAAQAVRVQQQQGAFEALIERTPCLQRHRGQILERNTCREPWSYTTIASLRQVVDVGAHRPEISLDIFNVLNLLNARWGRYRVAAPRLLEHVGSSPEAQGASQPIFRYDPTSPDWTTLHAESAFNLQLGMRYRF